MELFDSFAASVLIWDHFCEIPHTTCKSVELLASDMRHILSRVGWMRKMQWMRWRYLRIGHLSLEPKIFGSRNGQVLKERHKIGMAFRTAINSELDTFWSRKKWKNLTKNSKTSVKIPHGLYIASLLMLLLVLNLNRDIVTSDTFLSFFRVDGQVIFQSWWSSYCAGCM